jgi:hypothetical protein
MWREGLPSKWRPGGSGFGSAFRAPLPAGGEPVALRISNVRFSALNLYTCTRFRITFS